MDGFTGFTPVQNRLIGELQKVCDKIMLTVEIDRREDPFVYKHPYQLFALSKQMVTSLTCSDSCLPFIHLKQKTGCRSQE